MKKIILGLFLMCFCGFLNAQSTDYVFSEVNVGSTPDVSKANFAYALTNYVQWDAVGVQGDLVVGVLGNADAVSEQLEHIASFRPIIVENYASIEDIGNPNVLFIAQTDETELNAIHQKVDGQAVVLINASQGFQSPEVGVNLWLDGGTLKYSINEDVFTAVGLTLNDRIRK